jgi:hypothetical protein
MQKHRPSLWKSFFANPANAFVGIVSLFVGILAWLAEPDALAAAYTTFDLRPWLDPVHVFGMLSAFGLFLVGLGIAFIVTKTVARHYFSHRRPALRQLLTFAVAQTKTAWKNLIAIGHATAAMIGAALPAFRHRSAPLLS